MRLYLPREPRRGCRTSSSVSPLRWSSCCWSWCAVMFCVHVPKLPNVCYQMCGAPGTVVQVVTHTKRRQHSFQVIIRITSLLQLGLQLLNNGLQLRLFLQLKRNQFGLHPLNLFLHLLHGLPSKQ